MQSTAASMRGAVFVSRACFIILKTVLANASQLAVIGSAPSGTFSLIYYHLINYMNTFKYNAIVILS
jgi:hypothetical protein